MKRVLSWGALLLCMLAVCLLIKMDMALLDYIASLYAKLSAFLKLIIIIFGGTFVLGLAVAPIYYGSMLTFGWCESICESKKGMRYTVLGIYMALSCLLEAISRFELRDIPLFIYGIVLLVYGIQRRKEYNASIVEARAEKIAAERYGNTTAENQNTKRF